MRCDWEPPGSQRKKRKHAPLLVRRAKAFLFGESFLLSSIFQKTSVVWAEGLRGLEKILSNWQTHVEDEHSGSPCGGDTGMLPGLWEVVPDVRRTLPQCPVVCSCLPSPPEPVCWLEFVGLCVCFPQSVFKFLLLLG